MVKKVFKQALWMSLGVTIGGVLLPRLLNGWRYNDSYPPLALHILVCFFAGCIVCFLTAWLMLFLKSRC